MNKIISLITFIALFSLGLKSQILTDTVLSKSQISICQLDTLIIRVNNVGASSVNHTINVRIPSGYSINSFDAVTLANQTSLGGNLYSFQINNLITGTNTFRVYTQASCVTNATGKYRVQIFNGSMVSQLRDSSVLISVFTPNIVIQGVRNTNSSNQAFYIDGVTPLVLASLKTGDVFERRFKVKMTTISSRISGFTVRVPKKSYDILGVSHGAIQNYSAGNDSVEYVFNVPLIGGTTSDSIIFVDTVRIQTGCITSTTSIASNVEVLWGCLGRYCDSTYVIAEGNMISPNPNPVLSYITSGHLSSLDNSELSGYSFCEENFVEFRIENTSVGNPIAGAMFDTRIQIGASTSAAFYNNNLEFDSVLVNGVRVDTLTGSTKGKKYIDTLTSSYTGGGMSDINGDGFYNDIQPGNAINVRYYFKILDIINYDSCFDNVSNTFWNMGLGNNFWIQASYKNICDVSNTISTYHDAGAGFGLQLIKQANDDFLYNAGLEDSLFSLVIHDEWRGRGINQNNFRNSHVFIIPNYVVALNFSSSLSGATLFTRSGALYDTVIVTGVDLDFTEETTVDFVIRCALKTDRCSNQPFQAFGKSILEIINASGDVCDSICTQNNSLFVQDIACDSVISEMLILDTLIERATFGWTDKSMTTLATRNTPGVILEIAHNFDSLRNYTKAVSHNSITLDSLFFTFKYLHPFTNLSQFPNPGFDPVSMLQTYAKLRIYDQSSGTDQTFIIDDVNPYLYSLYQDIANTGVTQYTFDFTDFIDTMRLIGAGPAFVIGGDTGSFVFSSDTVELELYFYGNQLAEEFQITPQVQISSTSNVDPSALPGFCLLPSSLNTIDIKEFSLYAYYRNLNQGSCDGTITSVGQGFASPSPNYYFPEVRQIGVVDTMTITWNGNYLGISDSVVYFDEERAIFGSLSLLDTLPKDPLRYRFSGDSVYIFPQDSTWQKFMDFSYGLNLQQTCQATTNAHTNVRMRIVGNNYVEGIGGPFPFVSNSNSNAGIATNNSQTLSEVTILPLVGDTACWISQLSNSTLTYSANNWMNLSSSNGTIDVFQVDLVTPAPFYNLIQNLPLNAMTNGEKWVRADDALTPAEVNWYKTCATIDLCTSDSLVIKSGFNCVGWPDSASFTYPTAGYVCPNNVKRISMFNGTPSAIIEYLVTNQPSVAVNPCDTLDYTIQIRNVGLENADTLFFSAIDPSDTGLMVVIPNSSVLEFPSGNFTNLPNPFAVSSNKYQWNLSSVINQGNPLQDALSANNEAWISYKVVTGCPFSSGSQIQFEVAYVKDCGVTDTISTLVSDNINIIGVPTSPNKIMQITDLDTNNDFCAGQEIQFGVVHQGGSATGSNTYVIITMDSNFNIYDPLYGYNQSAMNGLTMANSYLLGNQRVMEFNLNAGFATNDSMNLIFKIEEDTLGGFACGNVIPFKVRIADKYPTTCSSNGSPCDVYLDFDTTSGVFNYQKANYAISNFNSNYTLCNDSLSINFDINVANSDVAPDNLVFNFYADLNANGTIELTDQLLTFSPSPLDTLRKNTTTSFSYTISQADYINIDVCQLILRVDTNSSCACSNAMSSANVSYKGIRTSTSLNTCIDSVVLGGCIAEELNKTYNWVDANGGGAASLLSSTTLDSVSFYPNTNITNTTSYTYYLEVNRGSCIARDTLDVIVNPVATGLTYSNGQASYELCSDSLNFSFTLNNTNSSSYGAGGVNSVEIYADSNQNGIFDGADVLLSTSFNYDSILANGSLSFGTTISQFNAIGFDVCNLIVRSISTSGCGNDSNSLIIPVIDINTSQSFAIGDCDNSMDLTICDALYSNRIYSWVGQGTNNALNYISTATAQSVIFTPQKGMDLGEYTYIVDVIKGNCTIQDTIKIMVTASSGPCGLLVIPAFISPSNQDGLNDGWILNGISNYPGNEVKIFNRWGEIVYSTVDYDNGNPFVGKTFNGKMVGNGATLPSGTYFYSVDLKDGYEPRTGFVHVENK